MSLRRTLVVGLLIAVGALALVADPTAPRAAQDPGACIVDVSGSRMEASKEGTEVFFTSES